MLVAIFSEGETNTKKKLCLTEGGWFYTLSSSEDQNKTRGTHEETKEISEQRKLARGGQQRLHLCTYHKPLPHPKKKQKRGQTCILYHRLSRKRFPHKIHSAGVRPPAARERAPSLLPKNKPHHQPNRITV